MLKGKTKQELMYCTNCGHSEHTSILMGRDNKAHRRKVIDRCSNCGFVYRGFKSMGRPPKERPKNLQIYMKKRQDSLAIWLTNRRGGSFYELAPFSSSSNLLNVW